MSDPFATVASELPRDRWGRPLITPPEGGDPVAYMRVTTFVKAIDDTFFLNQWSTRMVALGMAARKDLILAAAAISDPDDASQKRTLNRIAKDAQEAAKAGAKAAVGTALHSFTETIDQGLPLPSTLPDEYVSDLAAYAILAGFMEPVSMEGFVVHDGLRIGGSYDRIWRFTAEGLDAFAEAAGHRLAYPDGAEVAAGDTVIGDLKTGKSVDFAAGSIACQMGAYANSLSYDHTLGSRSPLPGSPSKRWGLVIHAPAGTGTASFVWADIAAGWETAHDLLPAVHAWRKRKDLLYPVYTARVAQAPEVSIPEQIRAATTEDALRLLYAAHADVWTPGLTSLAKERIKEISAA